MSADVICMAREAGGNDWGIFRDFMPEIELFAALVAAAKQEECAKVCDERAAVHPMGSDEQCEAEDCAAAIRALGRQHD